MGRQVADEAEIPNRCGGTKLKDGATMKELGIISAREGERLFEHLLKKAVVEGLGRKLDEAHVTGRGGNPVHLSRSGMGTLRGQSHNMEVLRQ